MGSDRPPWPSLAELQARRAEVMKRLVDAVAATRGFDPERDLSSEARSDLEREAAGMADDYFVHALVDHKAPRTEIERLLAELYEVDGLIFAMTEGGRGPSDNLH
jgi:hypothetical protein